MNNESKTVDIDIDKQKFEELIDLLDAYTTIGSKVGRDVIDGHECEVRFVLVTPDLAAEILENHNSENRPFSQSNVAKLVKEINSGNWSFNGEPISFNSKANVSNGQHRLQAIVLTGIALRFLVTTGLDPKSFATMDNGRKRTGSDVLAIAGVGNYTTAASVCKFVYSFKNGNFGSVYRASESRTLTNTQIESYYTTLTNVDESIKFGAAMSKKSNGLLKATILGGFHYLLSEIDEVLADEFLTKLSTGIDLKQGSPIISLRNRLLKSTTDDNYRITSETLMKLIAYSWEKFVKNETVKNLKLPENYEINLYGSSSQKTLNF